MYKKYKFQFGGGITTASVGRGLAPAVTKIVGNQHGGGKPPPYSGLAIISVNRNLSARKEEQIWKKHKLRKECSPVSSPAVICIGQLPGCN